MIRGKARGLVRDFGGEEDSGMKYGRLRTNKEREPMGAMSMNDTYNGAAPLARGRPS